MAIYCLKFKNVAGFQAWVSMKTLWFEKNIAYAGMDKTVYAILLYSDCLKT